MSDRWYEFTQVETFERPFYVKASSLDEARRKRFDGVADYSPTFPTLDVKGRGRLADQEIAQAMADERGGNF